MHFALKTLIPRAVLKRRAVARRAQRHRDRFQRKCREILELYDQYRELEERWRKRGDSFAANGATQRLERIRVIIRDLSSNGRRPEIERFLEAYRIPGWRRAVPAPSRRR